MYQSGRAEKRLVPVAIAPGAVIYLPMDGVGPSRRLANDLGSAYHDLYEEALHSDGSARAVKSPGILKAFRKILRIGDRAAHS